MTEKQYKYAEAARELRVAESTLRRWVSQGKVPCHRLGRSVRFTEDDLAAALKPVPPRQHIRPQRTRERRRTE
ncbi:helix-turn-helix domain-containing protein [Catenuloplanes atrovinosus]|uniref:helix-turn-helix domain-containing protein n=1 Tax=Catenuloplanes atrovinosus TaxID=137266 RepID=UPI0035B4FE87